MKNLRVVATALALAGSVALPGTAVADGQNPFRHLGWVSSLNAVCVDPACLKVAFTLDLNGLKPNTNTGNSIPGGSGGYVSFFNVSSFAGGPWFTIVIFASFTSNTYQDDFIPGGGSTPGNANLSGGPGGAGGGGGGNESGPCETGTCLYDTGDFPGNVTATATPEPLSMTLLATGLVGLMLVARRRRKQNQQAG